MKRFITVVSLATLAIASHAQPANFTGPAIGVGIGSAHNTVDYGSNGQSSASDTVSRLEASYGLRMSAEMVLTVGVSYDLNKSKFGRGTYTLGGTQTVDAIMKHHWSVYAAPGFLLSPNWLLYTKLSAHQARGEYTDSLTGVGETTHHGTGIAIGVATPLSKQLEGRFEIQQIRLNAVTRNLATGKPRANLATAYLDYRF
jgi:hypothetical protein